ncbi:hypothetical protein B0T24DRAFT_334488 [Lasiosphaeria ovina]|uniref:Chorismate synthase protein n=1 Tax=Lasiosphaeria ovina TaxID=92902 RepID=A0AAE0K8Q5_9PEZI|nr:hypothetical protein B0T24DRAFT_334488 [Lasiosphaeria ovina]
MEALSWANVKSLLIFFGPILVPKALGWYRSLQASRAQQQHIPIRPLPSGVAVALTLLLSVAACFLLRTLPVLSPENVFAVTQSRLQIPVDVLFTRLSTLRPLSAADYALRHKFVNLESRLLYLQFGPDVLAACPFCAADDPRSYLWYALPALAAPHLLNLVAIALATAPALTGHASRAATWRTPATLAAVALAVADIYLVGAYNYQRNARATRLQDLDFFFWTARVWRAAALAGLDALLAWAVYATATNRAFTAPPAPAERVEAAARVLASAKAKLNAAGIVKNTAIRDDDLRRRSTDYWTHEVRLMRDVMEDRDVIEGVNDALLNRIDIASITRDAEVYARNVLQPGS